MMNIRQLFVLAGAGLLYACATPVTSLSDAALEQAAQQGNGEAQYFLARKYVARQDYVQAMNLMKKASDSQGVSTLHRSDAARQVGDWYQEGLGEPRNMPQARVWWKKASRMGNAEASYQLARDCQPNHAAPETACLGALETAAKQGNVNAQRAMAHWYSLREGGDAQSVSWLEKAAKQHDAQAQAQLAEHYEQGKGVEKRPDLAERLYSQAAQSGYAPAQFWMARHSTGQTAFNWYRSAAQGNDPRAQRWLAQAYLEGRGVARDEREGLAWLERAVRAGDPQAQWIYSQRQTSDDARERYLTLAANGGNADAQAALARRLQARGELERARHEWAILAAKGHTDARLAYGEMLRLGQGGKEDFALAFKQYRLAAQAGNRIAQYRAGMMRQEGLGVSRNRVHAYAWYSLASTEGMKDARQALDDIENAMQPDEIKAAQKLAMTWSKRLNKDDDDSATPGQGE